MLTQKKQSDLQKITIYVPKKLLANAKDISQGNTTETVKSGLQLLITTKASENIRKMRGKVKFSIDVNQLRADE